MRKKEPGERTLLASVVLSAPGPLVLGLALLFGRSSTQLADFIRRTAELAAIIVSWTVFRMIHDRHEMEAGRREKLERTASHSVGIAMCLSGAAILFIAIFSPSADKGNVIPGLVIAFLGVLTNTWFWLRYSRLHRESADAILAAQKSLYRAKSLVDGCVVIVLAVVAVAPQAPATRYIDLIGSVVVSAYLVVNGLATIRAKKTILGSDGHPEKTAMPLQVDEEESPSGVE